MNSANRLILASSSPRRQLLMREVGFEFEVRVPGIDESFPADLDLHRVPGFLARKKATVFNNLSPHEIVITSDTVVILGNQILNKPGDPQEAFDMLSRLSGNTHKVITSVCFKTLSGEDVLDELTEVTFKRLSSREIETYVETCKPFDKAGSYGAQECLPPGFNPCSPAELKFLDEIGNPDLIYKTKARTAMVAIDHLNGSYFNVMGLPIHTVYYKLTNMH